MKLNSSQISIKPFFTQNTKVAHTDSENFDINPECEANTKGMFTSPNNQYKIHAVV